jgi:hypothetical protein
VDHRDARPHGLHGRARLLEAPDVGGGAGDGDQGRTGVDEHGPEAAKCVFEDDGQDAVAEVADSCRLEPRGLAEDEAREVAAARRSRGARRPAGKPLAVP